MSTHPIFRGIFGESWNRLPAVMRAHYANRPFSRDVVTVEGTMKVELSAFAKLLSPLLRLSGALVPYSGDAISVTVHFRSEPGSDAFVFDRVFRFPGREPYRFRSRMVPVGGNEVVEWMPIGIGWRAAYAFEDGRIRLTHRGYVQKWFGKQAPLPIEWLMGRGSAQEEAIDDTQFRMRMDIRHPLLGTVYAYGGEFRVTEVRQESAEPAPLTEGQLVKTALGPEWCFLSAATQRRFETDPDTPVEYTGVMTEVRCSPLGKAFALVGRLFGSPLIPYNGTDVPIDVRVYKEPGSSDILKQRTYHFPGRPFTVETRMHVSDEGEFIEYTGRGLGMAMALHARDGSLYFHGQRYVVTTPWGLLRIPAWLSPGMARIEHSDHGETAFRVRIEMRHPWFGLTFVQDGIFEEKKAP